MYAIVQSNSTSGIWVAVRTSSSDLRQSRANIACVLHTKAEAEAEADYLNGIEDGSIDKSTPSPNGLGHVWYD